MRTVRVRDTARRLHESVLVLLPTLPAPPQTGPLVTIPDTHRGRMPPSQWEMSLLHIDAGFSLASALVAQP